MTYKAKFTENVYNAANMHGQKECVNSWIVNVIHKGEIVSPVRAFCWMGRSSNATTVYASIWVHGKKIETTGSGSVGGCGYHKESAAIQEAIASAGIELYDAETGKRAYIDGVGDSAIHHALEAIARALGYRGKVSIV